MKIKLITLLIMIYISINVFAGSLNMILSFPMNNKYDLINKKLASIAKKHAPPPLPALPLFEDNLTTMRPEGILLIDGKYKAIINGNVYNSGEVLLGHKIITIMLDYIEIQKNKEKVKLYVQDR